MRQVVLVVVLVAAAFLGGAFVNGPGLRWVQTQILGSLGLNEGGEIASVDLKNPASPDTTGDGSRPARARTETVPGPRAPIPSPIAEGNKSRVEASNNRAPRQVDADLSATSSSPTPPASTLAPPDADTRKGDSRTAGRFPKASSDAGGSARLDPDVKPVVSPEASGPTTPDRTLAPAVMDSLAALMPSAAPPPPDVAAASPDASPSPPPRSEPGATATAGDDWAALHRKMQALGVSRYTIEGQPGGHVVFSCLIPLAGRQAVTQRFEAEGEDGFRAAQATLRRVALWRATQQPAPP